MIFVDVDEMLEIIVTFICTLFQEREETEVVHSNAFKEILDRQEKCRTDRLYNN